MATRAPRQMSDEQVKLRTGRGMKAWGALLDRWGAATKGHPATAKYLAQQHGLSSWWSQMVTVMYERDRGLREIGQKSSGSYSLDVQRTIRTDAKRAYAAWVEASAWNRWFSTKTKLSAKVGGSYANGDGDTGTFLALVPGKRLRFTWDNAKHCPGTVVEVVITPTPDGRVKVGLTHTKLRTKKDREEMKGGWSWAMDSLRSYLETGAGIPHEVWLASRKR